MKLAAAAAAGGKHADVLTHILASHALIGLVECEGSFGVFVATAKLVEHNNLPSSKKIPGRTQLL